MYEVINFYFRDAGELTVITGSSVRSEGGQLHKVEKIIVHENYDNLTDDNDITLLQVLYNNYRIESLVANLQI